MKSLLEKIQKEGIKTVDALTSNELLCTEFFDSVYKYVKKRIICKSNFVNIDDLTQEIVITIYTYLDYIMKLESVSHQLNYLKSIIDTRSVNHLKSNKNKSHDSLDVPLKHNEEGYTLLDTFKDMRFNPESSFKYKELIQSHLDVLNDDQKLIYIATYILELKPSYLCNLLLNNNVDNVLSSLKNELNRRYDIKVQLTSQLNILENLPIEAEKKVCARISDNRNKIKVKLKQSHLHKYKHSRC